MKKITRADIKTVQEYESIRDRSRREVIALKKARRVSVGEFVTLVFENRATVIHQIQEMMRVEHLYREEQILQEIDAYNRLIPNDGELSATLFVEVDDPRRIKPTLDSLRGIDKGQAVFLRLDAHTSIPAVFETGHSNEDKVSAVHYLRFVLDQRAQRLLGGGAGPSLVIEHPNYRGEVPLRDETRSELMNDLNRSAEARST